MSSMIPPKAEHPPAHLRGLDDYSERYRRSLEDPEGFWLEEAKALTWVRPPTQAGRWDYDEVDITWYPDGQLNASWNCVDRHADARPDSTAILWVEDEPGRYHAISYRTLQREVCRLANVLIAQGVRAGRPRLHLPADDPGADLLDARLRAHRRHSFGGVRRIFGGEPAPAHPRRLLHPADHRQRGLARRAPHSAQADRRRGDRADRLRLASAGGAPHRRRDQDARRPRPLAARGDVTPAPLLPGGADGVRGAPVHALHLGLDRTAQGRPPHHGRLSHLRCDDASLRLRSAARRRLLLRGRHRLDHRPQLHRLRPARQRRHHRDVGVDPHLSRRRALLAGGRRPGRDDLLYGAYGAARDPAPGRRVGEEAQPQVASRPRLGRRADQPRGLALVPRRGGRGSLLGGRHLVADRDRRHPDHAARRSDAGQAWVGDAALLRRRAGAGRPGRSRAGGKRPDRQPVPAPVVAGPGAHSLRRSPPVSRDLLLAVQGPLLHRRRLPPRRGRLLLDHRSRRRRAQRRRAPAGHGRDRERAGRAPRRRRGRGGRCPARHQGHGGVCLRPRPARLREP